VNREAPLARAEHQVSSIDFVQAALSNGNDIAGQDGRHHASTNHPKPNRAKFADNLFHQSTRHPVPIVSLAARSQSVAHALRCFPASPAVELGVEYLATNQRHDFEYALKPNFWCAVDLLNGHYFFWFLR